MNFEFAVEEQVFISEVRHFLAEESLRDDADELFAPDREADAMLVDSKARRAFMKRLAQRGYLGMSWPIEYGGQAKSGIFEYLLNEELASVGAPQIGKGVGCIGKTLINHGSEKLKQEFLPQILRGEIEFALGYSEPEAGSDLAALRLKAVADGEDWVLNGQKMWTTSAHFADWYWVAARTNPEAAKHKGISVFLLPMDHPGLTVQKIDTMGDHRTNMVFFDNVRVHQEYLVGGLDEGWRYICEALDYERFTLFTIGPLRRKFEVFIDMLQRQRRNGAPLATLPEARAAVAQLATELEAATMLQRRVLTAALTDQVPTVEAAMFKLYSTQLGRRLTDIALDLLGPQGVLGKKAEGAVLNGKWEHSYRATVVDTIGGGSTEVQKNIIARRGLGLPV
jgi:3-oxocholest-4-en-26-oyl-CoA dehydrogenase alpha subunit